MAEPIEFPEANAVLKPPTPEDAAAGTVCDLHIFRYKDLDGNLQVMSCWKFTPEELEEIQRTGVVWFNCWGHTHPPIWIAGERPFND